MGRWTGSLLLLIQICACSSRSEQVCAPGAVQACACPAGQTGIQTCDPGGQRWDACEYCTSAIGDAGHGPDGSVTQNPDASDRKDSGGFAADSGAAPSPDASQSADSGATGPVGSRDNPVPLDRSTGNGYGYSLFGPTGQYSIPRGGTVWFKADPLVYAATQSGAIWISVVNYDQVAATTNRNITLSILAVDRTTGAEQPLEDDVNLCDLGDRCQTSILVSDRTQGYDTDIYYMIEIVETGFAATAISIWWS